METKIQIWSDKTVEELEKDFKSLVEDSYKKGQSLMTGVLKTESIKILHHPYKNSGKFPINRQTGRLYNSFQELQSRNTYHLFYDEAKAKYAKYVILGTKNMKPRDVLNVLIKDFPAQAAKLKE